MEERDVLRDSAAEAPETDEVSENRSGADGGMTVTGWLWRLCIPIIPCAGIIIYIVLLCMWAFGKKQTESMRVWAKAALIATIIKLAFAGVIFLIIELNLHLTPLFAATLKKILQ